MTKTSVAVIGAGFVGGSLAQVLVERGLTVYNYDKAGKCAVGAEKAQIRYFTDCSGAPDYRNVENIRELVESCSPKEGFSGIYFCCLPTPMWDDGECDLSIVESVLEEFAVIPGNHIVVVKSTIPPGSTEKWNKKYENTGLRICFSPEFLTEKNAVDDMRNQNRIILGGPRPYINVVKQLFQTAFPNVPIIKTSSSTAEFVKYFTNIQLMARVVLSCELWQIANKLDELGYNVDYDKIVEYAKLDPRLGGTHMNVPGENGIPGGRGHCFPKDLSAMVFMSNAVGMKPKLMEAIRDKNLELVPPEHRDWEKMVGRAYRKRDV